MSCVKNLGNNAIFSKVFRGGLRYYMILENYPEYLQKIGYFLMWVFLKSLQNYRKFNYGKRVKEQLTLPLLNSGRCAHRPRYNRHRYQGSAILPNNQCSIGATAASS